MSLQKFKLLCFGANKMHDLQGVLEIWAHKSNLMQIFGINLAQMGQNFKQNTLNSMINAINLTQNARIFKQGALNSAQNHKNFKQYAQTNALREPK